MVIPILLTILSYFVSISFMFMIPGPKGIGYTTETYYFEFGVCDVN